MTSPGVLVVTNEQDVDADFVIRELTECYGALVVRLNTERATKWQLTVEPGNVWTVRSARHTLSSKACTSVWWRRPSSAPHSETAEPAWWETVREQWRAFFAGMASVPGPRWVSSPFAIRTAESKALQLHHAAAVGLRVPRTLWTNSQGAVREMLSELGDEAVCKSVASAYWEADEVPHFVFARRLRIRDLPQPTRLALAPLTFQRAVAHKCDVRATVVGESVIAAVRKPSTADESLDWRLAPRGEWQAHALPSTVAEACSRLVNELNLRFAGIDLALDNDGNYWFIELNPNGEWGWLQVAGLPIAKALADELVAGALRDRSAAPV